MKVTRFLTFVLAAGMISGAAAQTRNATLTLDFSKSIGPMEMDHISLGQGGISPDPMWDNRIAEIRTLHPRLIRLFVQEYFNVISEDGQYHFDTLDQSVNEIVRTGALPLMCIAIKPKLLFPTVDQDVAEPNDYGKWERLISRMVSHYKEKGLTGFYWEVGNEGDIGESGGSPYRFTPEGYVRYYRHTVAAILKADPTAHVGGPALSDWKSPLLSALLTSCEKEKVPLSFVSWHIYDNDPKAIQDTIVGVKALLAQHPSIRPETILNEWNMALTEPPKDLRIQPAFVAETAWRMKESGLTYSCFFHIRDYHAERDQLAQYFSPNGASFVANWWNRMPQYSGLFDYQNVMRPMYFTFQLLARVTGSRLEADSSDDSVHAFLSQDKSYHIYNLLFWNFSDTPVTVKLDVHGLGEALVGKRRMLDAESPSEDENARLRPLPDVKLLPGSEPPMIPLEPYEIESWTLESPEWQIQLVGR
jgi:hypothetical protein